MRLAAFHALGLAFSLGMFFLGRFLRRNPSLFAHFFTFGASDGTGIAGMLGKAFAWIWLLMGGLGAVFYLVLIPIDLLSRAS